MEIKELNLHPCKHCNETGTCTSGDNGYSCLACVKRNELKVSKEYKGLACGICGGIGKSEPFTDRLNNRITPFLAMWVLTILLASVILLAFTENPNFSTYLAFASTLAASIITFYFSRDKK